MAKHTERKLRLQRINSILRYFNTDVFLDNRAQTHVEESDKSNLSWVETGKTVAC